MAGLQELSTKNGEEFHGTVLRALASLTSREAGMESVRQIQSWTGIVTVLCHTQLTHLFIMHHWTEQFLMLTESRERQGSQFQHLHRRTRTWGKRSRPCCPVTGRNPAHRRGLHPLWCWALMGPWGWSQRPDYQHKRTPTTSSTD